MSRVIITEGAVKGLERCRRFLAEKNRHASKRAAQAISQAFELLASSPGMVRPLIDMPDLREWVIPFGESGYTALYRYDPETDAIVVLAFRHQKESGY